MPGRSVLIGFTPFVLAMQVSLPPGSTVPVRPHGSFLSSPLALPPETQALEPLGLASADLDEDGVADLIAAHGSSDESLLVIRLGNIDSIHPYSPEAVRRKEEGTFHEGPFLPGSRIFALTGRADVIATGDFDADGHQDVLTAGWGDDLLILHAGNGRGSLGEARIMRLPGRVTALTAGEVNRADGLADLVIGLDGTNGPAALVLEGPSGAFEAEPEIVALPAPAETIDLARLDDDIAIDMTVRTPGPRVVIRGRDRTSGDPGEAIVEILPQEEFDTRLPESRVPREATGLLSPAAAEDPAATLEMRLNRDAIPDGVILTRSGMTIEMSAPAEIFTVTSAADDGPGSLREAIVMANENEGADWIVFDIPGPGPHTIESLTPLHDITDPVTIDATAQPDFAGSPVIELSGAGLAPEDGGLVVTGGSSVIRGLVVNRFGGGRFETGGGIVLRSSGNIVEGNYVGTDRSGSLSNGNEIGVLVEGADNLIGGTTAPSRNVISGNETGVLDTSFGPNVLQGNYIGTDAGGMKTVANLVGVLGAGSRASIVGAATPSGKNVISGNTWGIRIFGAEGLQIRGNYIGTDMTGMQALGNVIGMELQGVEFSTIGGSGEGAGNIISGNDPFGIWLQISRSNTIQGNHFGTDPTGTTGVGNWTGIALVSGEENLVVENLFCDNQVGIALWGGDFTRIQRNIMGLTSAGEPLLNHMAIQIDRGNNNLIGGEDIEDGNTIAYNNYGVFVMQGTGNTIRSNSIHSSNAGAIFLQGETHRDNDYADFDTGPNDLQNFPFFFDNACGDSRGLLQSERLKEFTLDFYASDRCYPEYTEGKVPLGSMKVTTDDLTDALFSFPVPPELPPGTFITATATNDRGSTSEFSECVVVLPEGCARPVARIASDVFECNQQGGAVITLDASPSTDANSTPGTNDDIVSFEWFSIFEFPDLPNRGAPIATGEVVEGIGSFTLGTYRYPLILQVTDSTGLVDVLWFDVEVVDTAPPVVDVPMEPAILWPPNHRMVEVGAQLDDRDVCTSSTTRLVSVSSSEPDDDPGGADGTTVDDVQGVDLGTRDVNFLLRAERAGGGGGRAYTLTYESTDLNGNSTLTTAVVLVPHDMGGVTEPLVMDVVHDGEATMVSWDDVPGAIHYNVVQGDVANLKRSSKSFHMGNLDCLASETGATSVAATADPAPGQTYFYLVEYDDGLPSGFGTESAAKDRFAPSGQACP